MEVETGREQLITLSKFYTAGAFESDEVRAQSAYLLGLEPNVDIQTFGATLIALLYSELYDEVPYLSEDDYQHLRQILLNLIEVL